MNSIKSILPNILGTTREKIAHAVLKEFIASNSLCVTYKMKKEDFEWAFEDFKKLVESLPQSLKFVEFENK